MSTAGPAPQPAPLPGKAENEGLPPTTYLLSRHALKGHPAPSQCLCRVRDVAPLRSPPGAGGSQLDSRGAARSLVQPRRRERPSRDVRLDRSGSCRASRGPRPVLGAGAQSSITSSRDSETGRKGGITIFPGADSGGPIISTGPAERIYTPDGHARDAPLPWPNGVPPGPAPGPGGCRTCTWRTGGPGGPRRVHAPAAATADRARSAGTGPWMRTTPGSPATSGTRSTTESAP